MPIAASDSVAGNSGTGCADRIVGTLLGMAVGDAIGLPYEGLSRRRISRILHLPLRHRFLFGRGMVSDDTEHACLVAQSLIASRSREPQFASELARRLRYWLLGMPAGIGRATLLALIRLWCGWPPHRSGVHSAGNGPLMRAPVLGAAIQDESQLIRLVRISTRLTHTDPRAELAAIAVALAARTAARNGLSDPQRFGQILESHFQHEVGGLLELFPRIIESTQRHRTTAEFALELGLSRGVSGSVMHTLPVVLHACLMHPSDVRAAVTAVIECGGDTDTTAAIAGGIVGAAVGPEGIPPDWLTGLIEWPRSPAWMNALGRQLAASLADADIPPPPRLPVWSVALRNLLFTSVVLAHAARRLLPPY
jgi:ADP-ribosylglycohydrolase